MTQFIGAGVTSNLILIGVDGVRKWIRSTLEYLGIIPRTEIIVTVSPEYPNQENMIPGQLHVVGERGFQKWAYFKCPCGCGVPIMLSLSTKRRPSWQVKIDWLGRPTIHPSVWQTDGCYAHFWVRHGQVQWCPSTGRPYRKNDSLY
jgi:hypothetical protein